MSLSKQALFALAALMVAEAAADGLHFTYPRAGHKDYIYRDGDTAVLEWMPYQALTEIHLTCGPDRDVYAHANSTGVEMKAALPGSAYHARWVPTEGNNTYCMFCAGDNYRTCSGTFQLQPAIPNKEPTIWTKGNHEHLELNKYGPHHLFAGHHKDEKTLHDHDKVPQHHFWDFLFPKKAAPSSTTSGAPTSTSAFPTFTPPAGNWGNLTTTSSVAPGPQFTGTTSVSSTSTSTTSTSSSTSATAHPSSASPPSGVKGSVHATTSLSIKKAGKNAASAVTLNSGLALAAGVSALLFMAL